MTNEEWEFYIKKCNVPEDYRPIIRKYRKCFGQHISEIGKIPGIKFEVKLERIADSRNGVWRNPSPFHTEPYSQNPNNQTEIEKQLDEQLEAGVVKASINPSIVYSGIKKGRSYYGRKSKKSSD